MAARPPNREIFARLLYVREVGNEDQRNAANARLALLRDAFNADRRFPSARPVMPAIETECWTWWHEVSTEPVTVPQRAQSLV
ncbi:hypothetical protein [Salinarimonas ramus]|uniref:Uncharacterized protein n=1 Tax=Salinarimonas ramus TaxID=690164 RepID=A0A917V5U3_9HYPH|nr:hypothetical protein [Salinarimonas ramus]GGK44225.1 hypothetical protein GCM10011322_34210 [Salinarimonas ramus]